MSGNRFGEQDQEVCRYGYQIPVDHADNKPNKMGKTETGVSGAKNLLAHSN